MGALNNMTKSCIFICVIAVCAVCTDYDVDKLPENELVPSSKLAQLKSRENMDFGASARGSTFRTFGGFKASFARVEEEALVEMSKLKNKGASCLMKKSKSWKGYAYQVPEEVLQAQRELGQAVQSLLRQAVQAEECYQEKEQPPTHQLCKPEQRCLLSDLCQGKKKTSDAHARGGAVT